MQEKDGYIERKGRGRRESDVFCAYHEIHEDEITRLRGQMSKMLPRSIFFVFSTTILAIAGIYMNYYSNAVDKIEGLVDTKIEKFQNTANENSFQLIKLHTKQEIVLENQEKLSEAIRDVEKSIRDFHSVPGNRFEYQSFSQNKTSTGDD